MQSCCFRPPPGSVVLDMCAAPGMKTSLYAAMVGNKGTVYAIERQQNRYDDMVNIVTSLGATCVKAIHNDAGLVGPDTCENVEYIVVDPSCSGSGMQGRSTLEDVELQFLPKDHPSRVQSAVNLQRIQKLQNLQTYLLKHALSNFPSAKCVVYSTCSTDSLENEAVVSNCLNCARLNGFEVLDCRSIMKDWKHFGHPSYDCGERTVYTRETDLMNGGFFAVFVRRKVMEIEEVEEGVEEQEKEEGEATRLAIKLLDPKPGSVILNMASSFNILDTTLSMATKMQNMGKIYLFNDKRLQKRLKLSGVECAVVEKGSALSSSDANCPGVESVLVFPESSGSSKSHPSADPKVIHQKFVHKQFSQLRHALTSFPHAKRIIYATESIHAAENEAVIDALLVVAKFHGFILADATMVVAESGWENSWRGSCRQSEYHCGEKCLMRQEEDGSGMFVAMFERNSSAKGAENGRDGQVKRSFDDEGNDGSGDFGDPQGTSRKGNSEGTLGSSGKSGKTKRQKTGKGSGNLGSSGGVNGRTISGEDSGSLLEMTDVESLGSSVSYDDIPGEFFFGTGSVGNLSGKGSGNLGRSGGVNGRNTSGEDSVSLPEMIDVESLGSSVSSDDFPGEFSFGTGFVGNSPNCVDESSFVGSASISRSKSGADLASLPNFVDDSSFEGSASVSNKSKSGADLANLPNFVDDSSFEGSKSVSRSKSGTDLANQPNSIDVSSLEGSVSVYLPNLVDVHSFEGSANVSRSKTGTDFFNVSNIVDDSSSEGSVSVHLPNLVDVPSLEGSVSVSEGSIFGANSTNPTNLPDVASLGSSAGLPQIAVFDTDSAVVPNMTDVPSLMTSSADSTVATNATVPNSMSSVSNSALVADSVILPKSDSVSKFATATGSNLTSENANMVQFPEATKCPENSISEFYVKSSLNAKCDNSSCFRSSGKSLLEVPNSSTNDKSLLEVPDIPSRETFTLDTLKNNPVWQSIMTKLEKALELTSPVDLPLLKTLAADTTFMAKLSSNFSKCAEVLELSSEEESASSVNPEIAEKPANTTSSRFVGLEVAETPLDTGISRSADPEITEKSVNTTFLRSSGSKLPNTKLARSEFTKPAEKLSDSTFVNHQTFVPTILNPQTYVPTPTSSSLSNCPPVFKASPDDFFIFNNRGNNDQSKDGVNKDFDNFGTPANRPSRKSKGMRLRSGTIVRGDLRNVRPVRERTHSKSEKKKRKSKSEKKRNRRKMSEGENCSNNGNKIPKIAENLNATNVVYSNVENCLPQVLTRSGSEKKKKSESEKRRNRRKLKEMYFKGRGKEAEIAENLNATNVVYSNMENCRFGDMNVVSLNMENRSLGDSNVGSSNMENSLLQILTGSKFFVIVGKGNNTDVVTRNECDNLEGGRGGKIDETVIKKEPDDTGSRRERECWCDITKHYCGDLGGGGGGEWGGGEHRTKKKRKKDGGVEGKNGGESKRENCGKKKETRNIFQWWRNVELRRWRKKKKNLEKKKEKAIKKKDEEAKTENKDVKKKKKRERKKKKKIEEIEMEMKDKNEEARKNDNDEEKKKKKKIEEIEMEMKDKNEEAKKNYNDEEKKKEKDLEEKKNEKDVEEKKKENKNEEAKKNDNDEEKKNNKEMKDKNDEMKKNVEAKKENEDVEEKKKNKEIKRNEGWNKKKLILHHLKLKDEMMRRKKNLKKKQKKEEARKKNEEMEKNNDEAKEKREMMMKMENMKKKEEVNKKNGEIKRNNEEAKEKREMIMKMENMKKKEEARKKNEEMKKNNEEAKEKREMMMKMENMKKKEEVNKKNGEIKRNNEEAKEKREMMMKMENMKKKEEARKKNEEMKKNNEEAKGKMENQKNNLIFHLLKLNKNEESKKKRNLFLHLFNVKKKDEEMKKKNKEMKENEGMKK
ncbi:uncharacterized protein LOC111061344 isoform X2 [Nilaparvata lugens]|uniref:uncharacterized protein LOC111061344 isoform X2 n=1 Tax=Nilaparvata lugens TaxID=108931 RepID=UPI00193E49AB|nr:uncharacterized protein LOC111061344 isoform X2 [Nilaparvata lugens]